MKFIGKSRANLLVLLVALAATLAVRHFVYTPDCNLLIVSVTFLVLYTVVWLAALLCLKLR